jgi:lipopolysaccharide transport system ATP-binding protein
MSELAIRIQGLGKLYRLGANPGKRTLRESLTGMVTRPFRNARSKAAAVAKQNNDLWALRDVNFDVKPGEVIGLIGRSGAGKSTLLKILSRITDPTEGHAEIHGRVGSLLEVGTGFHPELTGRENIFLNGALLGMRRAEIVRKFDEIVAFSEMERFLETPVKRYSSGMYTRLAFAVAAHLEPEIMVVDEVLAVGDAAFQKKCLGKMGQVARQGRTVILVSHNMAAIQSLCTRAVLLHCGQVKDEGNVPHVVESYLQACLAVGSMPLHERKDRGGDRSATITSVRIENFDRDGLIHTGSRLKITMEYQSDSPVQHPRFFCAVCDTSNVPIFLFDNDTVGQMQETLPAQGRVTLVTEAMNITAGRCYVNIALSRGGVMADYVEHAAFFDVESADVLGTGKIPPREWSLCVMPHKWSAEQN